MKSWHKCGLFLLSTLTCGGGGVFLYIMMEKGRLAVISEDTILMSAVSMVLPVLVCVLIAILAEHHTWQAAIGFAIACWAIGSFSVDNGLFHLMLGDNAVLVRTLFTFFLPLVLTYLGSVYSIFVKKEYEYTHSPSTYTSSTTTETDAYGRPTGRPF